MGAFLDTFFSIIPETQRNKLREALRVESDLVIHEPSIHNAIQKMSYEQVTELLPQDDKMDSDKYNKQLAGFYADLHILFNASETIDMFLSNDMLLNLADLRQMKSELDNLRRTIRSLEASVLSSTSTVAHVENFTSQDLLEPRTNKTRHLYTDRDGTILPEQYIVMIDASREGEARLPEISDTDAMRNIKGHLTAKTKRIGKHTNTVSNMSYPITHAVDGSLETFWGEVALVNTPITNPSSGLGTGAITYINEGAVAQFEVILDRPRMINEVSVDIFGNQPLDIVSIEYFPDLNSTTPANTISHYIVGPQDVFPPIVSRRVAQGTTFRFSPVTAQVLLFTISQRNFKKVSYLVREDDIQKKNMWESITSSHMSHVLENKGWKTTHANTISPAEIQEKLNELSGWNAYMKIHQKVMATWLKAHKKYEDDMAKWQAASAKYEADLAAWKKQYNQ